MCGILYHSNSLVDLELGFADRLKKRGPDFQSLNSNDFGHWYHTRLSLIDLTNSSNQPRINKEISFIYNGEIFNYSELCSLKSDTLYLESELPRAIKKGTLKLFLNSLNGFFSIIGAINNKKTYLIRDRYGEKPLYFHNGPDGLVASSSLLVVAKNSKSKICNDELFNQSKNPFKRRKTKFGLKTIYTDVYEVLPGTFLEWSRETGSISVYEWYDLSKDIMIYKDCDFKETLLNAVKIRGKSEAKGAITLSGGVDSTVLAALLVKSEINLPAFTFKSSHQVYCEHEFALSNSSRLNIDCNIVEEKKSLNEIGIEDIFSSIHALERPFFDPNLAQSSLYAELRSKGFKFTIDGHGADELFSGYPWNMPDMILQSLIELKFTFTLRIIKEYFSKFPENYNIFSKFRWLLSGSFYSILERFKNKKYFGYKPTRFSAYRFSQVFSKVMVGLLHNYDRMSMQNSIEVRSPFLDHRLVAMILSNSDLNFFFKTDTKQTLRSILLENDLSVMRKKIGFRSYLWHQLHVNVTKNMIKYFNSVLSCYPQARELTNFKNGISNVDILLSANPREEHNFWRVLSYGLFMDHEGIKSNAGIV